MMYCPQRRAQNPETETWNFEPGTFSMQSGFLLVSAIFLLVILAALGAFILTISGTQQTSSALDVQGARAYQAARAGIDWASYQLLINAGGAVAFDAAASTSSGSSSTTLSWTHTASGTNRVVIVGVSYISPSATATATYGGTSMTLVGQQFTTGDSRMAMFSLVNPPTGAKTVTVTFSVAVNSAVGGSVSMTGANQTTPTGTFVSAVCSSGGSCTTTPSLTVTSVVGEMVIDTLQYDNNAGSITPGAGQNQRWNLSQNNYGGGSTEVGAASVAVSWTAGSGDNWAYGAVSVKAAPPISAFITACNPGPTTQNVTGMGGTLSGFTAAVTCSSTATSEAGATVTLYQITSTGAKGTVGTLDRVERQLQVTLTH
jgi:Tfp pilus assembly protein PilX